MYEVPTYWDFATPYESEIVSAPYEGGAVWNGDGQAISTAYVGEANQAEPALAAAYQTGAAQPDAGTSERQLEAQRAERALLARVNTSYDVWPDVGEALSATARSNFGTAVNALRRAAMNNPDAVVSPTGQFAKALAVDQDLAQRARYALNVYTDPPRRVLNEADAKFMVAALSGALGKTTEAREAVRAAKAAGDSTSSTELLARSLSRSGPSTQGPWVMGRPLNTH